MKVIFVRADEDYNALYFQEQFPKITLALWKECETGVIRFVKDGEDYEMRVSALEFKEVDPKFISFIRSDIQDYDESKHADFFIVEESE